MTSPKAQRTSHQKLRAFQSHWPAAWQRLSMKQARTIPMQSDATPTIQLRAHHSRPSQRGAVTKDGASGGAPGNREQGTPSQHRRGASDRWKLRWERRSTVSGGRPPALRGGGYPHLPREVGAGTDVRERSRQLGARAYGSMTNPSIADRGQVAQRVAQNTRD